MWKYKKKKMHLLGLNFLVDPTVLKEFLESLAEAATTGPARVEPTAATASVAS